MEHSLWQRWQPRPILYMCVCVCVRVYIYRQTSKLGRKLVSNKIADHRACRGCSNYIFVLDLTPGVNGLSKKTCKTRRVTLKLWDSVRLILHIWQYIHVPICLYIHKTKHFEKSLNFLRFVCFNSSWTSSTCVQWWTRWAFVASTAFIIWFYITVWCNTLDRYMILCVHVKA